MFVSEYEPMKRIAVDGLDGTISLLHDRTNEAYENGEACAPVYEGAWLALSALRVFNFQYPRDYMNMLSGMVEKEG